MKAWQVTALGEPRDVMSLVELPEPTLGEGQARVKVLASAANFPDALMCRGLYQVKPDLPFTPGVELCGEVLELGPGVESGLRVGDRVIGSSVIPHGAFAEQAVVEARAVLPAPQKLTDAQAGGFFIGYQTGWFGLHRRAHLQAGETLLVHAAAGGVGSAAIQLGKAAGARVIGVVGGEAKAQVARDLGADVVVDRHTQDFVEVVKRETGGKGADVIYDPVGGSTYDRSTKCIAFEGRILIIGFAGGTIQTPPLGHALVKNYTILGLHWGLYAKVMPQLVTECHADLTRMVDEGLIDPLVSERIGLDAVADGVQRLADGSTVGRVVYDAGATS
ncbi:MAG: NADPH:quinone oxidoreductase family protein [Actinomycetota bacterium]|nr:NADPH:quinone oxidoreductase family protein [Actinomycetota bacterium]